MIGGGGRVVRNRSVWGDGIAEPEARSLPGGGIQAAARRLSANASLTPLLPLREEYSGGAGRDGVKVGKSGAELSCEVAKYFGSSVTSSE